MRRTAKLRSGQGVDDLGSPSTASGRVSAGASGLTATSTPLQTPSPGTHMAELSGNVFFIWVPFND